MGAACSNCFTACSEHASASSACHTRPLLTWWGEHATKFFERLRGKGTGFLVAQQNEQLSDDGHSRHQIDHGILYGPPWMVSNDLLQSIRGHRPWSAFDELAVQERQCISSVFPMFRGDLIVFSHGWIVA
jgi:hypothetical protein